MIYKLYCTTSSTIVPSTNWDEHIIIEVAVYHMECVYTVCVKLPYFKWVIDGDSFHGVYSTIQPIT